MPAYLFPQRTQNGLFLGKFIQRIKTQICTFFVMKILDALSQILNVKIQHSNATDNNYAKKYIMYAKQNITYIKHQVRQTKTRNQNLASATWFYTTPQPPKPSMLHVIDGTWKVRF